MKQKQCPQCNGNKIIREEGYDNDLICHICNGSGKVSNSRREMFKEGEKLRALRLNDLNVSIMTAAKEMGITVMEMSRMEQGFEDQSRLKEYITNKLKERKPS